MVEAAVKGNNTKIDMTVGDIYGGDYDIGSGMYLAGNMIGSSFGRL